MAYFGSDDNLDPYIDYATPPTARSGISSGSRFTPRTTPRTPRTDRTPRSGFQSHISKAKGTPKGTPQGPTPNKNPTIWKTSTWQDDYIDETLKEDGEDEADPQQDFWGQLWSRAGYAPTADGKYVRTHIPLRSSLPTERDIQLLAEMEERRIEQEEEKEGAKPTWQTEGGVSRSYGRIAELTRFGEVDKMKEMLGVLSRAGTLERFINFQVQPAVLLRTCDAMFDADSACGATRTHTGGRQCIGRRSVTLRS